MCALPGAHMDTLPHAYRLRDVPGNLVSLLAGPACPGHPVGAYPLIARASMPGLGPVGMHHLADPPAGCRVLTAGMCGFPDGFGGHSGLR